jgi:hypothetical protein
MQLLVTQVGSGRPRYTLVEEPEVTGNPAGAAPLATE